MDSVCVCVRLCGVTMATQLGLIDYMLIEILSLSIDFICFI